ncbi:MAG: PT domain-containing protein [Propionibacteriaceae bacterium]|jgi:hypothetical protein|nr:PT domain-containing protein [Propionibacteriaceae bacterium]
MRPALGDLVAGFTQLRSGNPPQAVQGTIDYLLDYATKLRSVAFDLTQFDELLDLVNRMGEFDQAYLEFRAAMETVCGLEPSATPSASPTLPPASPTASPTSQPTTSPTGQPTTSPTGQPTTGPTAAPLTMRLAYVDRLTLTVAADGFEAGESVTATLYSTPVPLGVHTADQTGHVEFTAALPADLAPGTHTVVLVGDLSGEVSAAFDHLDSLAGTGAPAAATTVGLAALLALALAGCGFATAHRLRRRGL